jgi:hypothetical protein
MSLKTVDQKGRIVLGTSFAGQTVEVKKNGLGEWIITAMATIPLKEAWLIENGNALKLVTTGILEAKDKKFAEDPRKGQDYSWLDEVEE